MTSRSLKNAFTGTPEYEPGSDGAKPLQTVTADVFLRNPPPQRQWLLWDVLPLGVTGIVVAPGGTSKTMLMLHMALSVASGQSVCGGLYRVATPGRVLLLAGEDDQGEVHRRIRAIAATMATETPEAVSRDGKPTFAEMTSNAKKVHVVPLVGSSCRLVEDERDPAEFLDRVLATAQGLDKLRLVIIDPLRRFFAGDENDSGTASRLIVALERIAQATGATVLGVHHMNKGAANNRSLEQYAARGSSAFTDAVRWQLNLSRIVPKTAKKFDISEEDQHRYVELLVTKNNYAPPQVKRLFLETLEAGVLHHADLSSTKEQTLQELAEAVATEISSLHGSGTVVSRTEFVKEHGGVDGKFRVGVKRLRQAINKAFDLGIVRETPRPNHSGRGKRPMDLLPMSKERPGFPWEV